MPRHAKKAKQTRDYTRYSMLGGYVKGSLLKVDDEGKRTFTEVLPDGSTRGHYTYRDRKQPGVKAYRTPWMPVAHKVYTEKCSAMKKQLGIKRGDYFCQPMVIALQETTAGNNKYNLQKRKRKYYVIQEFYPEPRNVGDRSYFYEPRSWFMKWKETPLEFFSRIYGGKDEKRKILPPIPDEYLDQVERRIMLENFDPENKRDLVRISKEQPVTTSTEMRKAAREQKKQKKLQQKLQAARARPFAFDSQGLEAQFRTRPPRAQMGVTTPLSPLEAETEEEYDTIILEIDSELRDTQIPTDIPEEDIMGHILAGQDEFAGYAELLWQILQNAENPAIYADLWSIQKGRPFIDPTGEELTGEELVEIINQQRQPGESLASFLRSWPITSYEAPLEELTAEELAEQRLAEQYQ